MREPRQAFNLTHLESNEKVIFAGLRMGATSVVLASPGLHAPLHAKALIDAHPRSLPGKRGRQFFELTDEEMLLGRDQFCDIVLRSHTVSRHHARIVRTDEGYCIEDLSSLNGTYVNGRRIEGRMAIKDQDRIHIYEVVTVFHVGSPSSVTETAEQAPSRRASNGSRCSPSRRRAPAAARAVLSPAAAVAEPADNNPQARFRAALKISLDLEGGRDLDQMLPKILDSLFEIFPQASRGYILLAEGADGHLVPRAIKHRQSESGHSMTFGPISRKTALHVMSTAEALLMDEGPADTPNDAKQSVFEYQCAVDDLRPLMGPSRRPLGIVYLDTTDAEAPLRPGRPRRAGQRGHDRRPGSRDRLGAHPTVQSSALSAHWHGQTRAIQFLPQHRPAARRATSFYDFYQPADEVGGDYFGYIPLADGRLALAIGDVAGKGVSAALLMAHFCSEVRYCLATSPTPAEAVEQLNQDLSSELQNYHFVTFALCVLDPTSHRLTLVNAGHLPPLRRRGRRVEELGDGQGGLPLGCDLSRGYEQIEIPMEPGRRRRAVHRRHQRGDELGRRRLRLGRAFAMSSAVRARASSKSARRCWTTCAASSAAVCRATTSA